MQCFNCSEEVNPTLVYCSSCGVPLDTDLEDIQADEERKAEEARQIEAVQATKHLLTLALFIFAVIVALRIIVLQDQHFDRFCAYRVPYGVVEEAGIDPSPAVPVERLTIPLPADE